MKTKPYPLRQICFCGLLLLLLSGCAGWRQTEEPRLRLAQTYGLHDFDQVEELRYTFNVSLPDRSLSRSWTWEPKKDRVTFRGTPEQGGVVAYDRSVLTGQPDDKVRKIDPQFVNDNYWLLFPLRIYWDQSATVTADPEPLPLPIGDGRARRLVVRYPKNEGYTPGDVYELFIDDSGRIAQWVYRKGGDPTPTRITTWEGHQRVGPLVLSLDRRGAEGSFRVWFTDVAVRLTGRSDWITAR